MDRVTLLMAFGSVAVAAGAQVLMRFSQTAPAAFALFGIRFTWPLVLALGCHGLAAVLWLVVLSRAPLSRVYPLTAATQVLVPVLAWTLLREPPTWRTGVAALLAVSAVVVMR